MRIVRIADAPIWISVSGIGTDTKVEFSAHTCKINADITTPIPVVYVCIWQFSWICVGTAVNVVQITEHQWQVLLLIKSGGAAQQSTSLPLSASDGTEPCAAPPPTPGALHPRTTPETCVHLLPVGSARQAGIKSRWQTQSEAAERLN